MSTAPLEIVPSDPFSNVESPAAVSGAVGLPSPLTPFERFLLADDRPDYPMTFFGELRFTGRLNRDVFDRALEAASARHPLLRARVDEESNPPRWVPVEGYRPHFALDGLFGDRRRGEPSVYRETERLDVRRTPGLRVWSRVEAGATYTLWEFHHAVCDGHGAMRFIEDVLIAYDAFATGDAAPRFRAVDPASLASRGDFSRFAARLAPPPRAWWHPLRDAFRFHAFAPQPLRPPAPKKPSASFPGVNSLEFDHDQSAAIRSRASQGGGTLNDAALVAVFRTLHDWNRLHGGGRERMRVLVPINLRIPADEAMPAANRMSFGFITRDHAALRDLKTLAAGIRDETAYVLRHGLGLDFLGALATAQKLGIVKKILGKSRCLATAVLTNMGDPTRRFAHRFPRRDGRCVVGDLVLDGITGSPPLRPMTRVGFGIGAYAGRIVINCKCDPALFGDDDARRLLDMYAERLGDTPPP